MLVIISLIILLSHFPSTASSQNIIPSSKAHQGRSDLFTIRVLVIADYAIYEKWLKRSNNDARKAEEDIKFYFSHIIDGTNKKYKNLRLLDRSFRVVITGFHFAKKRSDTQYIEGAKISNRDIDGPKAIIDKRNWMVKENIRSKYQFDAALTFTGYNIKGLSGVAFVGSICSKTPAGIIRDFGIYENIDTTTHEMGHMLGSRHDGEQNRCNPNEQYIMSTVRRRNTNGNEDKFSSCSETSIQNNLANILKSHKCLMKSASQLSDVLKFLKTRPGLKLTPNDQCQLMYGSESYFCGGALTEHRNICHEMLCWNPISRKCDSTTRQRAADGTPCDDGKLCTNGKCVKDKLAPKNKNGTCMYGDFRDILYTKAGRYKCDVIVENYKWMCYDQNIENHCCMSCAKVVDKSKPDCRYGDMVDNCATDVCYDNNWKSKCCKTCARKEEKKDKDCPEGDRASWCSADNTWQCYDNRDMCCLTCKKHANLAAKGCEYGDRNTWCPTFVSDNPKECENAPTRINCCESCGRYVVRRGSRRN